MTDDSEYKFIDGLTAYTLAEPARSVALHGLELKAKAEKMAFEAEVLWHHAQKFDTAARKLMGEK